MNYRCHCVLLSFILGNEPETGWEFDTTRFREAVTQAAAANVIHVSVLGVCHSHVVFASEIQVEPDHFDSLCFLEPFTLFD